MQSVILNLITVIDDLMDRAPKSVDHKHYLDLPEKILTAVSEQSAVQCVEVRLREQGHVLNGDLFVVSSTPENLIIQREQIIEQVKALDWRLHETTVQFVRSARVPQV